MYQPQQFCGVSLHQSSAFQDLQMDSYFQIPSYSLNSYLLEGLDAYSYTAPQPTVAPSVSLDHSYYWGSQSVGPFGGLPPLPNLDSSILDELDNWQDESTDGSIQDLTQPGAGTNSSGGSPPQWSGSDDLDITPADFEAMRRLEVLCVLSDVHSPTSTYQPSQVMDNLPSPAPGPIVEPRPVKRYSRRPKNSPSGVTRKKHVCPWPGCGKAFKDKYSVGVHKQIHTGEKHFLCTTCHKYFRQKAHLAKHFQTHKPKRVASV